MLTISKPSASTEPESVTKKPSAPLFVITRLPVWFSTVPDTVNLVPSFRIVASPLFVKLPPIFNAPALFVIFAVPLFAAVPLIVKPPAPVFNIVKSSVLTSAPAAIFKPPAA